MILFLIWIIRRFKNIPSGHFREIKIIPEIKEFIKNKRIRNIVLCHSILQFFYSWMVIYVPLYLVKVAGFDWGEAAVIISISLLPFLLFEIPVGEMADKKLDEREIIICGFLLSGLALVFFPVIPNGQFILWAVFLFAARSGASLIETATESYFFRSIKGRDELIGIFRIASPFAFIIGPLVGSGLLRFTHFGSTFFILGFTMFMGAMFALNIKKDSLS
jgi:predicted MFS family arabinose efflux permease